HGNPTRSDIEAVRKFQKDNAAALSADLNAQFDELLVTMEEFFAPVKIEDLKEGLSAVSEASLRNRLSGEIDKLNSAAEANRIQNAAEAMWSIRENIGSEPTAAGKLALMDLSLKLESLLVRTVAEYAPADLKALVDEVCHLSMASAASGYTELWEWNQIRGDLNPKGSGTVTLEELNTIADAARNQLNWGTSYNKAVFDEDVERFKEFEPMAAGFLDDRIRGSVALYLGNQLGKLGSFITEQENLRNEVLDVSNSSQIHGLNPGYANGQLIVVEGNLENLDVKPENIYVFQRPPSDLRPVGGILNIAEGNLVSHLQLLARNLGIPNASISNDNLQELKKYNGQRVFYAVSNKGTVILKKESEMTAEERELFKEEVRSEEMIEVPVDKIRLDQTTILNLTEVDANSSGAVCGPKAANLGELKKNFPDHVVDGFVIPFGIFRAHLDQQITGGNQTYWEFLTNIYATARKMKSEGSSETAVEKYQLEQFAKLSEMIIEMPMLDSFVKDLEDSFTGILGKPLGQQPVFLRSDTNMEDLASFTGAGLNLTLFNILKREEIVNGIKKVWASPFSDRSYRWRQKYLNNPENVYPSIVVIPGVNNDASGVMITKGVSSGRTDEITVAMSRGVGGAVEGQLAETWAIRKNGAHQLIAPSRELYYNSLLPSGGTEVVGTSLEEPIMGEGRIQQINSFSKELIKTMESRGIEGPYDVELGFKDRKIWLFQVRPFVENKGALSSEYLQSITPEVDQNKSIRLNTTF
ncbi:MAG: PEP/pyruvate-binding domain-containing protein, partial [Robiginitalea sp.]|nr:PEP/pyruvate-binding domain-containing protein [Robiginitalea sp.]